MILKNSIDMLFKMHYWNIDITGQNFWDVDDVLLIGQLRIVSISKFTTYENLLIELVLKKIVLKWIRKYKKC